MNDDEQHRQDFRENLLSKIEILHDCVDRLEMAFKDFTTDTGVSIKDHEKRITIVESQLGLLLKVSWLLFASSVGVIGLAFWKLILRQ